MDQNGQQELDRLRTRAVRIFAKRSPADALSQVRCIVGAAHMPATERGRHRDAKVVL